MLTLIRDILLAIKNIAEKVANIALKRKVDKAMDKLKEGDQTGVEDVLTDGDGGNPTKHKYDGLRTQKAKKRR